MYAVDKYAIPEIGIAPWDPVLEYEWFTLLHGTGSNAGLYAIKSDYTGKVLYSRRQDGPLVSQIASNGQ